MSANFFYISLIFFNCLFTYFFSEISKSINIFDFPDKKRKFHLKKTACIGGILIFFNLLIFLLYYLFLKNFFLLNISFFLNKELLVFIIFLIFFLTTGIIDDKFILNANYKFIFFTCGIYLLVNLDNTLLIKQINFSFASNSINIESVSVFFTVLSFLLFINAFNMFDGINLQASIYSLFFFVIFFLKGIYPELCITIILSLIFFSYLNYKNKCFLGNNGSLLVAYVISFISIKSVNSFNIFKADEIFLMMLIPGLDLFRLVFFRILKHKHPFSSDRNHMHHILIDKFNLNKTLAILMTLIIIPNTISLFIGYTMQLILISTVIYFFIIFYFQKKLK
jgi:UDP-GlcNAc:undecaprenyl-phosphate GlcNAc-1-phosphate transferase